MAEHRLPVDSRRPPRREPPATAAGRAPPPRAESARRGRRAAGRARATPGVRRGLTGELEALARLQRVRVDARVEPLDRLERDVRPLGDHRERVARLHDVDPQPGLALSPAAWRRSGGGRRAAEASGPGGLDDDGDRDGGREQRERRRQACGIPVCHRAPMFCAPAPHDRSRHRGARRRDRPRAKGTRDARVDARAGRASP